MVYKVIGLMSGSSLDGLDIVCTELHENGGIWSYEVLAADCYSYERVWAEKLRSATTLNALDYQLLHTEYGHYTGQMVNRFIEEQNLHYKVALIASHGHTTFHLPSQRMTAQLGDGSAIAAETGLPVVSDLRALDVALGGQGAPIVPIGEKLLFPTYSLFLNIGGIANISCKSQDSYIAFDVCPANRVLNILSNLDNKEYDDKGEMASTGHVHDGLLQELNGLEYYVQPAPKSLANSFGTDTVLPLIKSYNLSHTDALRTYVEHIVQQTKLAISNMQYAIEKESNFAMPNKKLLITGGGAFNKFLIQRLSSELQTMNIDVIVPDTTIIKYKEALVMALIGVLRWRQEYNVLSSVTGASRDTISGAVWIGHE
jgi:anhydro-N-acetylmuramic acid kinase